MGGGEGARLFVHASGRPAVARSRAPRFCRGRICRRRAEFRPRRARAVRLCDAGAVEDRRERGVLQRHVSARRRDAHQARQHDARDARRRAVLSLPRAVDRGGWQGERRPHAAGRDCDRRAVRGRGLRRRRRDVHRRARPRDQFQAVRAGRRPRAPVRARPAAPSRCGCGPIRILPSASKLSAGRTASRVQKSTAASARPSARASPMAA